jgi:hypothetical protein
LISAHCAERNGGSRLRRSCKSSLELRDQGGQGFRLLIRGEVTAGQPLDPKAESQSFVREIDLPMLKGIFATAADEERELVSINPEEAAKVEPIALRFAIGNEARCGREVEQAIVAIQGAVKVRGSRHQLPDGLWTTSPPPSS